MEGCEGRPRSPRPRGARWRGDCMSKASTLQIFTSRACGEPVSRVCTISSATELRVACVSRRKQCVKFSHYEKPPANTPPSQSDVEPALPLPSLT
ncbi:uncharacterized protein LOC135090101 isoform X2 [Scylla paramamosain]|uniref:uncharacterized protein LOC135090101 isoform X2 n=1 Tax=Scylla paramamosain TaxID=85552 RepID=UPI0030829B98